MQVNTTMTDMTDITTTDSDDYTVCEVCGWLAAIASALAFGSFGVPIKSRASLSVDIDPLVFQSYKTFMCFSTSWLILLTSQTLQFTPWGIVSGLFWVPGGVATIYAIKSAGLAIGIGIGSSFIVLVSFVWGIFVFREPVHSQMGACVAILFMVGGLIGMSYFSAPVSSNPTMHGGGGETEVVSMVRVARRRGVRDDKGAYAGVQKDEEEEPDDQEAMDPLAVDPEWTGTDGNKQFQDEELVVEPKVKEHDDDDKNKSALDENDFDQDELDDEDDVETQDSEDDDDDDEPDIMVFLGVPVTKRQRGMMAAAFCGIWGGSVMAPMKWCKADTKGTGYLISFAIGASIVTLSLWLIRFLHSAVRYRSLTAAYFSLPSFHLGVMWKSGGMSGLLWSIGNYFSLIAVLNLGEGVGYPLSQTSILISGLWGIFYFQEVTGVERISKWLISSLLTIFGILLLSYEHHEK